MGENALYYTLSTIAQTLAAALGVLTAIFVIRLPGVENAVQTAKTTILTHHGPTNHERAWPRPRSARASRSTPTSPCSARSASSASPLSGRRPTHSSTSSRGTSTSLPPRQPVEDDQPDGHDDEPDSQHDQPGAGRQ